MSGSSEFDSRPSNTNDFKFVVEARHIKGSSRCQNNVAGCDIKRLCLWYDISVRQHFILSSGCGASVCVCGGGGNLIDVWFLFTLSSNHLRATWLLGT